MNKTLIFTVLFSALPALSCTYETINSLTSQINPYYEHQVQSQMSVTLDTLKLCDENLEYAGQAIGRRFNPYQELATARMARIISERRGDLQPDLIRGLGLGLIEKINIYFAGPTSRMLQTIVDLGGQAPEHARIFALELMKKQNSYFEATNANLLQAVKFLTESANQPSNPNGPLPDAPPSSIWALRSNNAPCEGVNGPWGYYEYCPRFFASVADQYGNRVVLACKAENLGIDFRVTFGQQTWSRLSRTHIQSLAFGTSALSQSLGTPYVIEPAQSLMAQEPMSMELLDVLRSSNNLSISVRSNSGETNTKLSFSLKGSNAAITKLLQHCQ